MGDPRGESPIAERNKIRPKSCSIRRAIFGEIGACIVRINMSISTSWWAIFLIIKISAYRLHNVALLKSRMETLRPCTGLTSILYLEVDGIIGVIGRVRIPLDNRITKIRSGHRKVTV